MCRFPISTGPWSMRPHPKPIRGASVEIVNSACGSDRDRDHRCQRRSIRVACPRAPQVMVRIKAQMLQGGSGATWDVTVRDNTQSDAIHALETQAFSTGAAARHARHPGALRLGRQPVRLDAGRGAVRGARHRLHGAGKDAFGRARHGVPGTARLLERQQHAGDGNPALGQIGTTRSRWSNARGPSMCWARKTSIPTNTTPRSSPTNGGTTTSRPSAATIRRAAATPLPTSSTPRGLFRRLGQCLVGHRPGANNYTDSVGPGQAQGANIDLTASGVANPGWFREASVHSILWRLNSQVGFKPINDTMTGAAFKNGVAVTSIHPFTAAFGAAASGQCLGAGRLLTGEQISAAATTRSAQRNKRRRHVARRRAADVPAGHRGGSTQGLRHQSAGSGNKLGSYVYLGSLPPPARHYDHGRRPPQRDPDFVVYSGRQIAEAMGRRQETRPVGLPAGESVLVINDFNNSSASDMFQRHHPMRRNATRLRPAGAVALPLALQRPGRSAERQGRPQGRRQDDEDRADEGQRVRASSCGIRVDGTPEAGRPSRWCSPSKASPTRRGRAPAGNRWRTVARVAERTRSLPAGRPPH